MEINNVDLLDNDRVKIGSRILSTEALDKLLPSNQDIYGQVSSIRKIAESCKQAKESNKESNKEKKIWDREFDRHYNNIFSILGGRGSGKTSVLLTLKYEIMNKYSKGDIILPLIVPEKIENSGNILECIMGLLGDEVDYIAEEIKKTYAYNDNRTENIYGRCRKQNDTEIKKSYNELLKQFTFTKSDEYKRILINQYEGFKDYIDNVRNTLDSDQKLIVKFEEFIEVLIAEKRKLCQKKEPMIFIFFDDVDLSAVKCIEVLNIILRYLSHPNIVVFVAGDYKTFSEVITINALHKDNLLNEQMKVKFLSETSIENISALDSRKILTEDFLKKILPPAFRYYMPIMNDRQKAEFKFSTEEDNKNIKVNNTEKRIKYPTLYELIEEVFIEDKNKNNSSDNFLKYGDNQIIYSYFKIFDETQRGAMNAYYLLNSMRNYKFKSENEERERSLRIGRLLNAIVRSSSILNKYENDINKIITIKDNLEDIFIDYKYIENMINKTENEIEVKFDDFITIFILANFIENIVVIENKKINYMSKRKVHGSEVLHKLLNSQNTKFNLYPRIEDIKLLLQMYTLISSRISTSNIVNLSDNENKDYFLGKYFEILDDVIKSNESKHEFFWRIYTKDSSWVDHKIRIIMKFGLGDISFLINNIKQIYKKIQKLKIDIKDLENMKENINALLEKCMKDYNNKKDITKQLELDNQVKEYLISEKVILKLKPRQKIDSYFKKIVDYYEDRILFYETEFAMKKTVYKISEDIKEGIKESVDMLNSYSDSGRARGISKKQLEILNSLDILNRDYLNTYEFKELKEVILSIRPFSVRADEVIEELRVLLKYIEYNGQCIVKEEVADEYEKLIHNFSEDCINYIKIKTFIEVQDKEKYRKVEGEVNSIKGRESFYERFSRLRNEIKDVENVGARRGFNRHIKELEEESMQVNFNV